MELIHQILIAMPSANQKKSRDRSLIYIFKHDAEGAMGIVLNQMAGATMRDVLDHLNMPKSKKNQEHNNRTVLLGGPDHKDLGFVIHTPIGQWQSSLRVTQQVAVTTSKDILFSIAEPPSTEVDDYIFSLGCTEWPKGRLEKEIAQNKWLVCPADASLIFEVPLADRWRLALLKLGLKVHQLAQVADQDGVH